MATGTRLFSILFILAAQLCAMKAQADDQLLPIHLSELHLFSDLGQLIPAANVYPYSVNFPLWSDGASKQRWVYLPPNSKINFQPESPWLLSEGTILVKQINFDSRVETRVEVKTSRGWQFAAYLWNAEQSDATRVDVDTQVDVKSPYSDHKITWTVPSKNKCLMCHISNRADSEVIGFNTTQFGKNQLQDWMARNFFTIRQPQEVIDHLSYFPEQNNSGHLPIPSALFAKAYLAVNCSTCHRPGAFVPTSLDFSFS
jgi:hypothetical protein